MAAPLNRVTMTLTQQDIDNVEFIKEHYHGIRNKTHAVSTALATTRFIIEAILARPGTQLLFRAPDGQIERVVLPGLFTPADAAAAHPQPV